MGIALSDSLTAETAIGLFLIRNASTGSAVHDVVSELVGQNPPAITLEVAFLAM